MKKKTHGEFVAELKVKNPTINVIGMYVNSNTKIKIQCLKCKYEWESSPQSLVKGHACPKCANNIRKTKDTFVIEMQKINPFIEIVGEYKTALTPIEVRCTICGNEWTAKPNRLLAGAQCMNCVKPHTSFMEQFILIAFRKQLGEFAVEERNTTAIGMELDIYLPEYKYAIEPGTWLYHEVKAEKQDSAKRKKCQENGIRLITIYDTFPQGQETPFENDCYTFSGFLNEHGYKRLINLVVNLFKDIGIFEVSLDWEIIANDAYQACHYNAHEDFVYKLSQCAPEIEVLEQYKGTGIPIRVRNRLCNHPSWKARPYTLLKGIGCPECGKVKAVSNRVSPHINFTDELKAINPNIRILGEYSTITERIEVECQKCKRRWSPKAYSLLNGKGCPHCSAVEASKKRKNRLAVKTTEQFKTELSNINSKLSVLGEYVNNKTKIKMKCDVCGHIWMVVPASVLNGHGCPICARQKNI